MKWITESNPTFDISLYKDLIISFLMGKIETADVYELEKKFLDLKQKK